MNTNGYDTKYRDQQGQMLKLITRSFCRELANYGLSKKDIVTVSIRLLDYAMDHADTPVRDASPSRPVLKLADVHGRWKERKQLVHQDVSIHPLLPEHVPTIAAWLATTDVQRNFAVPFPRRADDLHRHFFETPGDRYCSIFFRDTFVGIIGAENIDMNARKLEMKKLIGAPHYRGLGIGKTATFLWLFYVFNVLGFNKVYIYALDTNIRNINLNISLGFELEGILCQDVCIEGEYGDVVRMSLLKPRWNALFPVENA